MEPLKRITFDPQVMGGKPCIRGMRVTVGTIVGLIASGQTIKEVLEAYPCKSVSKYLFYQPILFTIQALTISNPSLERPEAAISPVE